MIRRLILIFHLHNITIQNSAYLDCDSYTDSDVSPVLSEASSMIIFQLTKEEQRYEECNGQKRVFDTQQLEESFKMSKNYKKYGKYDRVKKIRKTLENKRYNLRSENDETLDSIELVTGNLRKGKINPIKQQIERCVKITNNQREYSFERKRIYPRNKRKIPSSPEESNKKN